MTGEAKAAKKLKLAYWGALVSSFLFLVAALACLRQWGAADPWSRIDVFSGTYFVLAVVLTIALALGFNRVAFRSKEVMGEAAGMSYDPAPLRWGTFLVLGELAVYLDYAHWHLLPWLEQRALQATGLGLIIAAAAWLLWTDSYLVRHFSGDLSARKLMTDGPFRSVRHPRYLSLLVGKAAFALLFASALAWLLFLGWILLMLRRMRLEEAHMRELFGAEYDAYAQRTARLLPGIY